MSPEELENKIRIIEHDFSKEISDLKRQNFKMEVKFESLLRYLIWEGSAEPLKLTVEKYQEIVSSFQVMNNKVKEINKINAIVDKVNVSAEFNKTSTMKIHGDDLGLKDIFDNVGGTSDFTARYILDKLPCSLTLTTYLQGFFNTARTPTPGALIPDQVVSK